jgi:hypothetical protein
MWSNLFADLYHIELYYFLAGLLSISILLHIRVFIYRVEDCEQTGPVGDSDIVSTVQ